MDSNNRDHPQPGCPPPGSHPGYQHPSYPLQHDYPPLPYHPPQPGYQLPPPRSYFTTIYPNPNQEGTFFGSYPLPNAPPAHTRPEMEEDGEVKGFQFNDISIRLAFIRKVYSILMCQLVITFGFIAVCFLHEPTKHFIRTNPALWWTALGLMLVTLISMACCSSVRRTFPLNYIFLVLFTFAEAFLLAMVASTYNSMEVLLAVGITAAVCLSLTLYAFQTKWDFTKTGGILMVGLVVLILFGILTIFFRTKIMMVVYASLGALLFSLYLIHDTQLIMGGYHRYSISPEEYVFAALTLYIDIINIFLFILTIFGATRD